MKPNPSQFKGSQTYLGEVVQQNGELAIRDFGSERIFTLSLEGSFRAYPVGSIVGFTLKTSVDEINIVELLATADSATAKIYQIVGKYKLTPFFSPEVLTEAETILAEPGLDDSALCDYEAKAFCTIDGPGTRDLDQALFIERSVSGYQVHYAIADAAFYIRPDSALFVEALKRGASFYLPDLMIPMLPHALCEGVISLNEHVSRRAVVFELSIDSEGRHVATQIKRARIKSRAKLNFEQVQTFLENPSQKPLQPSELADSLHCLKEVGLLRMRLAEEHKVVRYHRTEVDVKVGEDGMIFHLLENVRNAVELYNEQLSLLCNIAGAQLLMDGVDQKNVQAIFKVHAQPPEEKLDIFEKTLQELVAIHRLDPAQWLWNRNSAQPLSDYLRQLPSEAPFARIAEAINRQALIMNNRSMFSDQANLHYGVGAKVYARFSSPMREVVGVFLHKELLESVGLQPQITSNKEDLVLRDQVILMANRSKDLQNQLTKEANKLVMDQMFAADLALPESERSVRVGTLIGMVRDKLYVLLDEPAIEIKIYLRYLQELWQQPLFVDDKQVVLANSSGARVACLGDAVQITVQGRNIPLDQWIFQMRVNKNSA